MVTAALLLAGCTARFDVDGQAWTRPQASLPQVTLDEMDCARAASLARSTPETFVGGIADAVRTRIEDAQMSQAFARCMQAKGYRPVGT